MLPSTLRLFFIVLAAVVCNPLFAQQADKAVVLSGDVHEDSYLAGGTVQSRAKLTGDLMAAGALVEIDNEISADVLAAGGTVSMRARVGDDVRLAGGDVSISGAVLGDAIVAGGTVVLSSNGSVGNRAWFAGNTVEIYGKVGKKLTVAGRRVLLGGNVTGDVEVFAESFDILPNTAISGNVRYRSPSEANVGDGVKIGGTMVRESTGSEEQNDTETVAGIAWFGFFVSFLIAALVFFWLFPAASLGSSRTIRESPWISLGLGFALMVAIPVAIVLLLITLIGAWLGIALFLFFPLLMLAGFLTGTIWLGDVGLGWVRRGAPVTRGWRVLSISIALLMLWIVGLVPLLGCFVLFAVLLFGVGGLALHLSRHYIAAR